MTNIIGSVLKVNNYKVIILDNYYTSEEYDSIFEECLFLGSTEKMLSADKTKAAMATDGFPEKQNYGIFINTLYNQKNISNILHHNRKIFKKEITEELEKIDIIFRQIKNSTIDSTLLSYYEDGDYYQAHHDCSSITVLSWFFKTPKSFSGGDIYFEKDKNLFIECKNNRTIIFPSFLIHEVEKVKMNSDKIGKKFGRFCLSQFINFI
jgi:Rps23 Pro-64 3,4-dihydroxylase Tpa1-like proline 4-hydroxylase